MYPSKNKIKSLTIFRSMKELGADSQISVKKMMALLEINGTRWTERVQNKKTQIKIDEIGSLC